MDGWRFGIIIKIPSKGLQKGMVRVEVPFTTRPRYWVQAHDVNEVGDTTYHGPKSWEVAEERKERKAAEQDKANKKARRLRPKRAA
jgi:hypothetical protein